MPLLDDYGVRELLQLARDAGLRSCAFCGHHVAKDYCRSCDEFYGIHAPDCAMTRLTGHGGHRLTIVPFVEER